jgi:O-antigen ligase
VKAIKLTQVCPVFGHGIGTFKVIFPYLQVVKDKFFPEGFWFTAHNDFVQLYFEAGILGILAIGIFIIYLVNIFRFKDRRKYLYPVKDENATPASIYQIDPKMVFASLIMLLTNMLVHFPTRMCQTVLIIIAFIAFYQFIMKGDTEWIK